MGLEGDHIWISSDVPTTSGRGVKFYAGTTEIARITNNGLGLGVGSAFTITNVAPAAAGQVLISSVSGSLGGYVATWGSISTAIPSTTNLQLNSLGVGTPASGLAGEIRATNEITAYYSSDERLKENIHLISNPIEIITQIRGVYFDWTDDHITARGGEDGFFVRKNDIGVIAQEIEKVMPEIVATRDDGFKAVKYEKIIPLLIESIKTLEQRLRDIERELGNKI
jgi:hypothetical protein